MQLPQLQIDGLDPEALLDRINQDHALMRQILTRFAESQRNAADALPRLVLEDQASAQRRAHELKGMLGNIGATDLYQQAACLSDRLRDGIQDNTAELAEALCAGVPALCERIAEALAAPEEPTERPAEPAGEPDPAAAREAFAALSRFLGSGRAREAQRVVAELEQQALPEPDRSLMAAVAPLVRRYRLREALARLKEHQHG